MPCIFAMVLMALLVNAARALDCPNLASAKHNDVAQFLRMHAREADPECISRTMIRLGEFRTASDADILIDLLDFQRPESVGEKFGLADAHDKFPAVPALFLIGLPAVPELVSKLQDGEITETVRSNAIRTVVSIYRDDPSRAITTFVMAAQTAKTQELAIRLEACAKDAVKFCGKSLRDRCEAALTASSR